MIFTNPPLTGKPGRPRSTHCKRGHRRVEGEKCCVACRRLGDRRRYAEDQVYRETKKTYQRDYRAAFFAEHGYGIHLS